MKKWIRTMLLAIVLMVLFLPAISEKAEAATIKVSTLEELRAAVQVPHSTVQVQADISCSDGSLVEMGADDVVLDLKGHTLTSSAKNCSMFYIHAGHLKICNGTIVGTNEDVGGFGLHGNTKLVQLEDLTVKNTEYLMIVSASFGGVHVNRVNYTQNQNVIDQPCVYPYAEGKLYLNDVTIECWNSPAFEISNGAEVYMGNVTAERKGTTYAPPLLTERTLAYPRRYKDYFPTEVVLKLDGTTVNTAQALGEGFRRGKEVYVIEGTKLESTMTKTIPINTMSIAITEPKAGHKPDYEPKIQPDSAYLAVNNGYFYNDIRWSDITESAIGTRLDPDKDTFKRGRTYEALIYVTPKVGYSFSNETRVMVNGEVVQSINRSNLNQIAIYYTYTIPEAQEYEGGECTVDMTAGSVILTGEKASAFVMTEARVLAMEEDLVDMAVVGTDKLILDLDQDELWDVLLVAVMPDKPEEVDKLKVTIYKLPYCGILKGSFSQTVPEEFAEILDGLDQYWYRKITWIFSDTVESLYKVGNIADKTYTGQALKPAPTVQLVCGNDKLTLKKGVDYTVSYKNNTNAGTATVVVKGKDLPLGTLKKTFKILPVDLAVAATKTSVSGIKASYAYTDKAIKPTPTVKALVGGATKTLKADTDYTVKYTNNTNVGTATVTITGKGNYKGSVKKTFKITKTKPSYDRFSGADRYATSRAIADAYKKQLGVTKFSAVCIADGQNYPDALAGAYFAAQKKAPILVVHQAAPTGEKSMATINYVKANLPAGKTVYILGGPGSVPDVVVTMLTKAGYKVERLWGQNRYGSNLEILKAANVKAGTDFIVCTGAQFADALSASATGKPVLLVAGNKLTDDQKAYLKMVGAKSFTVVGTTADVAASIETELKTYAPVTRLAGATIYERSIQIARKFFPSTVTHINVADGRNFPDALCGGPQAQKLGGPLLLTDGSATVNGKILTYTKAAKTVKATVFGGPASVTDATCKYILGIN